MCDTAGELPDRIEALGLPEPLLEPAPRRDVARRNDHPVHVRVGEQVQPDGLHQPPCPVLVTGAELLRDDTLIIVRACEQLVENTRVVRMDELG